MKKLAISTLMLASLMSAQVLPYYKTLKMPPLKQVQLPKVEQFTLPNGIRVMVLENHELPLASGSILLRTGELFDPQEKSGLADIMSTVMRSGGTKKNTPDQLNAKLESMAASVEASVSAEFARVGFNCLKENLGEVMSLFKEVTTEPAFPQDKLDLALTQARSGISRRNDDANGVASREFNNLIYGEKTPYGDNTEYATLANIKRADLVAFHDRYFFPANAMISVQGDIDTAEVKAMLTKLFADWTVQRPAVPPFPAVTKQKAAGVYIADKSDSEQTFFRIGQLGGKLSDKDYPVLDVMADILGGGFSSRLFQKVRSDASLAYSIGSDWRPSYLHEGTFVIQGSTNAETTEEAIAASLKEVKRMREEMVGPGELEAAKQRVANSFVFNFDSPSKTLGRMMTYQYYGYPADFINQYKDAVQKVTPQEILRVAKEYIKPEEFTIVAVGQTGKFAAKLGKLGEVKKLDLTIPQPKVETAKADQKSLAAGKAALDKVAAAVGGKAAIAGVNDYSQSINSEINMGGNKVNVKQVNMWMKPAVFRQESAFPFGKVIAFFDGEKGFLKTPQGEQPLAGPFAAQVKGQMQRDYLSLLQSNDMAGRSVNLVKEGELEIQDGAHPVIHYFYDPKTMLPLKITFAEGGANVELAYVGLMDVSGLKMPAQLKITQNGQVATTMTVTEWKINSGLSMAAMSAKE